MKNIVLVCIYILFIPVIVKSQLTGGGGTSVSTKRSNSAKKDSDISNRLYYSVGLGDNGFSSNHSVYGDDGNSFFEFRFSGLYIINEKYQFPSKNIKYGIGILSHYGLNSPNYSNIGFGFSPTIIYNPFPGLVIDLSYNYIFESNTFASESYDDMIIYYGADTEASFSGILSGLGIVLRYKSFFVSIDALSGDDFESDDSMTLIKIDRSITRFGFTIAF